MLVLAQLFLPRIAASRISSRVARYGSVESVHVEAWPAVELLWGHADSVRVSARRLALTPAQTGLAGRAGERRARGSPRARRRCAEGQLRLTDVRLRKRGSALSGDAHLAAADVAAALPAGVSVSLLGSGRGPGARARRRRAVRRRAARSTRSPRAERGALVAASRRRRSSEPCALTLFSDPRVDVAGVGAQRRAGRPPGYLLDDERAAALRPLRPPRARPAPGCPYARPRASAGPPSG